VLEGGTVVKNELLWKSDQGDGTFVNPILFADYSDPDVIRVGDTFYMTASSFNFTPGLPILTSKDLVNWELKNYAIKTLDFERYHLPAHAKGIWAPALRYHDEKFWICYGMPDEGIFIVQTEDPLGKWSKPVLLLEGKGYIDPCPFWDIDGKAYIVHGYARSRIGFKSILGIFPIDAQATRAIGEDTFIYNGAITQPTIEGPKVYLRDGWYYIFAPAGGVKTGWQTVLRGRSILGPYEEKIVMHQGSTIINGPHQGGLVDTLSGEDWFIHFQDLGFYGRIVHLQPVCWRDDWPVIGVNPNDDGCGEPCLQYRKPVISTNRSYLQASDDFSMPVLGLQWQWLGNESTDFYRLMEKQLRLFSRKTVDTNTTVANPALLWNASHVLTQKFVCPKFISEIRINVEGLQEHELAGCTIIGGQYNYIAVKKNGCFFEVVYVESRGEGNAKEEQVHVLTSESSLHEITFRIILNSESEVVPSDDELTSSDNEVIRSRNEVGASPNYKDKVAIRFEYRLEIGLKKSKEDSNSGFVDAGISFVPSDHTWVGAKLGLFALALDTKDQHGYADFKYVKVEAIE